MKKEYILFIDSGIGGLSTLAKSIKHFNYDYIFYADNKHCPYGGHTKAEVLSYFINIINKMCLKFKINFIVIACNTATAAAVDDLRAIFKEKTIIGAEPAVALASKNGFKRILALTTPLTSTLKRYKTLCMHQDSNISTLAKSNLVEIIENYYFNQNFKNKLTLLKITASICKSAKFFDCIVLGCTHYVFLIPFIKQISKISLIDGNHGIANNLISQLAHKTIKSTKESTIKIVLSSPNLQLQKKYKKILSQTLANYKILC